MMELAQACAMQTIEPGSVTALLGALRGGEAEALDHLMPLVYEELRSMAHRKLRYERADHTLNTTALVHEAYLRLADQRWAQVQDRAHFFAIAAQAMRRILVSYARKHRAAKRGGQAVRLPLDALPLDALPFFTEDQTENLLALDEALTRLEAFNERGCRVVEYRFFGGLTHDEIAGVMGLSRVTVRRAWDLARMWLQREMAPADAL
jgi:RNA polymerase sigma factor (TIGR02999 family)